MVRDMPDAVQLTGITWDHTRGLVPLIAAAQRFSEMNPGVEIAWRKRSLQAFGDQPLQDLAPHFDLLVIDHPFVGYAAAHDLLVPLDEYLPGSFLADQAAHSVGVSHQSYAWGGHQWALAIDAATPVSAWRPDLLQRAGERLPETWEEVLDLARRGMVALPAAAIDSLMHVYMMCIALGEEPFQTADRVVSREAGVAALECLRELVSLCDPVCLRCNPFQTYEVLAAGATLAYCPFAYGYSNYAREGYAANLLRFGGLVTYNGRRLRSTLGGAGLAISRSCRHPEIARTYACFVADPVTQRGLYVASGGQPGHRAAWVDTAANALCHNYFRDTLATLDEAFLRPRYSGYAHFQDHAAPLVHAYLADGGDALVVLEGLDRLYRESLNVER